MAEWDEIKIDLELDLHFDPDRKQKMFAKCDAKLRKDPEEM